MAMGRRRRETQGELFVAADRLPSGGGHAFYERLNKLLAEEGFDEAVEELCRPYYEADGNGRPSIPPGVFIRMLLIGFFEGIGSQRAIAWRCGDSLSLRKFLGYTLSERTPDHSSLTRVRDRLPMGIYQQAFELVLAIAHKRGLLKGKTIGVDATLLEANAAMKSLVRKDSGEDWRAYVVRLMKEEGVIEEGTEPSDEEVQRFDRKRKGKKASNEEWESSSDSDARVAKMKDGRTHLAYKAEHAIDLETELILAAEVYHGNHSDSQTLADTTMAAQGHLNRVDGEARIEEVVADKGYHSGDQLELMQGLNVRTYIPEPQRRGKSRLSEKPIEVQRAVKGNRRRTKTEKNSKLQRLRSERVERSFAHVCQTGGARRSWLRGIEKVRKRLLITAAARNLGLLMRRLTGVGKPRALQGLLRPLWARFVTAILAGIARITCPYSNQAAG